MMPSAKPRSSMIIARMLYMMPMRLWSTLVNHSRHKYGHHPITVISASTASPPKTAPPPATNAIGSSNGIDSQVSLPSISASRRLLHRRTPGAGGARLVGHRRRLLYDAFEQPGIDRAEG